MKIGRNGESQFRRVRTASALVSRYVCVSVHSARRGRLGTSVERDGWGGVAVERPPHPRSQAQPDPPGARGHVETGAVQSVRGPSGRGYEIFRAARSDAGSVSVHHHARSRDTALARPGTPPNRPVVSWGGTDRPLPDDGWIAGRGRE